MNVPENHDIRATSKLMCRLILTGLHIGKHESDQNMFEHHLKVEKLLMGVYS